MEIYYLKNFNMGFVGQMGDSLVKYLVFGSRFHVESSRLVTSEESLTTDHHRRHNSLALTIFFCLIREKVGAASSFTLAVTHPT